MTRHWQFDALRGLMLVLMTVTHLPTWFSDPLGQPLGFVSAAEGFVLLSGFMAGLVYTGREKRDGRGAMRSAMRFRALTVYACQATLLVFLLSFIALLGILLDQPAITNLLDFYLEKPLAALLGGLLLVYAPPLLDILPMYVLFLLASPAILLRGLHHGWAPILAVSFGLWLGSQFGLSFVLYELFVSLTKLPVPYTQTGAFETLAWQLLWVSGLWLGARHTRGESAAAAIPHGLVAAALGVAAVCFAWRHMVGQTPFPGHEQLNALFGKWQLGPLRLINLFCLVLLSIRFADPLMRVLPRIPALEALGAASLPVFCTHLVLVLLALAFLGEPGAAPTIWFDAALIAASLCVMYAVARISGRFDGAFSLLRRRQAC